MRTTLPLYRLEGDIKVHPIAEQYFLPPSESDLERIALSIKKLGTIGSVTHYEGQLLDGRTLYRIAREQGLINFEDTPQGRAAAAQGKAAMDQAAYQYA